MSEPLRIIFAGTPDFAASHLKALLDADHQIICVMSQPDRPAGRGRKLMPSPVKQVAIEHDIPVWQPVSLKTEEAQEQFKALNADLMVVVAYGLILPKVILDAPAKGCINVHGSILPNWRGAAPIQRAIMRGDTYSGVTIMQMDVGLDTGDMIIKSECPILVTDSSANLHDRLIEVGCPALLKTIDLIASDRVTAEKQNNDLATYAHKLSKEEAELNWSLSATELHNQIRGMNPWPVASTLLGEDRLRVWAAEVITSDGGSDQAGTIVNIDKQGLDIQCGQGQLRILKAQLPGGKAMAASDLLNSKRALFEAQIKLGSQ